MSHPYTVFAADSFGNKNKVVLAVTIVLAIICAGLLAWLLYILFRPCKASSCGSKQATTGAKPTTTERTAVSGQTKPSDASTDSDSAQASASDSESAAASAEDVVEEEVEVETEDLFESAVRNTEHEDAAFAAQRTGDALPLTYANDQGELVADDNVYLQPSDDLEAIIASEASGGHDTDALNRMVPASRSAAPEAPTSVGLDSMYEEIYDAAGMTAQIPMTDEDEARARSAFDVDSRMPSSFFETTDQTSGRLADEQKLRVLAEQHPDRAAEILQNVSGAFQPTQDQLSRLRSAQTSMRPTMLYIPENDPSKGLYAALRPPVALPKSDLTFEFNAPMSYVSAQAAAMQ